MANQITRKLVIDKNTFCDIVDCPSSLHSDTEQMNAYYYGIIITF